MIMRYLFYFIGLSAVANVCFSQTAEIKLQSYPGARVVFHSQGKTDDYTLALGSYKKISGTWKVDRTVRLSGVQERITLDLPVGHSAENGFDFYLDQLQNYNIRELFHCRARACGTSNSWANNHFKIIQLYGLDQYQHYAAYEVQTANEHPIYVAIYAVQRGNKRVFVQVDVLYNEKHIELGIASSPESLMKALTSSGYYVFPDVVVDDAQGNGNIKIKSAHIAALIEVLKQQPNWVLALVGHDYAPKKLAEQQQSAKTYAEQLKAALIAKGVEPERLSTYGLGSLAPAGRGDRSARVEVVKL